jgi:hypothetical protein
MHIAFIDTESGRGKLFARLFDYDWDQIEGDYNPIKYINMIHAAEKAQDANGQPLYGPIIIDSLTHAWSDAGGVLDLVNNSGAKNTYTDGWGKIGTPAQRNLMTAIITSPNPIICTMRSKMDYVIEENERGKKVPRAVGLKPEQRDGVVYEFDLVLSINADHTAVVVKCPPIEGLANSTIQAKNYELFANTIMVWMDEGAQEEPYPKDWKELGERLATEELKAKARELFRGGASIRDTWAAMKTAHDAANNYMSEPVPVAGGIQA